MVTKAKEKLYQAFYTKSAPIVEYMVSMLRLEMSDEILDPCGGDGIFIESILERNDSANIEVCELNPIEINNLKKKFSSFPNVKIRLCDTLLDDDLSLSTIFGGTYDKIIANPPYGAWQSYEKRKELKKVYSNLYVKETYTLFLFRCIELLQTEGILSFIIPDTFLNLHLHKKIREYILTQTKIIEIALFPSSFFPNVNFGYANLSIITLQKSKNKIEAINNSFRVLSGFQNVAQLIDKPNSEIKITHLKQSEVLSNPDGAFLMSDAPKVIDLINNAKLRIGDVANCVTGFYSGNDKRFLKVANHTVRNGKKYHLINENLVYAYQANKDIIGGIPDEKCFIPIIKGGSSKFLKSENWFMDWSVEAVKHYKSDKKARFQNSQYYFKFGVGVPMVSSSSITASLINYNLFDQSIVGVFPKDESITFYLLALFNSSTFNTLIRTINPSTNNSANYIKKLPFIFPTEEQKIFIDRTIQIILDSIKLNGKYDTNLESLLNSKINEIYGF